MLEGRRCPRDGDEVQPWVKTRSNPCASYSATCADALRRELAVPAAVKEVNQQTDDQPNKEAYPSNQQQPSHQGRAKHYGYRGKQRYQRNSKGSWTIRLCPAQENDAQRHQEEREQ